MGKTCKFLSYCGTAVMVCHMSTHSFPLNFVNFAYRCVYMECLLKCVCVRTAVHVLASSVALHLTFWDRVAPELAVDRPQDTHVSDSLAPPPPSVQGFRCLPAHLTFPYVLGIHTQVLMLWQAFYHWAIYLATSVSLLVSVPLPSQFLPSCLNGSVLAAFPFDAGHNPGSCFAFSLFASINPG